MFYQNRRFMAVFAIGSVCLIAFVALVLSQQDVNSAPLVPPLDNVIDGKIVYVVSSDDSQIDPLVAPEKLERTIGSQSAYEWNEVVEMDEASPIDALVIHESALPFVDQQWVMAAYKRGVVIAGINIGGPEIANLVGNPSIANNDFAADTSLPMFTMVTMSVSGDNPEEVARVLESYSTGFGDETVADVQGRVSIGMGRSTDTLNSENGYNIFTLQLKLKMEDQRM